MERISRVVEAAHKAVSKEIMNKTAQEHFYNMFYLEVKKAPYISSLESNSPLVQRESSHISFTFICL